MRKLLRTSIDRSIVPICRTITPLGDLVAYVARRVDGSFTDNYRYLKARFIQNGRRSKWDEGIRGKIVERFEAIDRGVRIGTTPTDGLFLAEALLSLECQGVIVECGSYRGGSTAKLSILAELLGKTLAVFDSFQGLPDLNRNDMRDYHTRRGWVNDWTPGLYAGTLEEVRSNVQDYGEISVCTFHKGWFSETLTLQNLPDKISFAFTDVDLSASARDCVVAIWPKMAEGGAYFSHDIAYIRVLQSILDESLWNEILTAHPPILFGAGYGLGNSSPHLGFMVKGQSLTAEYIYGLTLDKRLER